MVELANRLPPARHPRAVKLARMWLGRLRERLLSLLLANQLIVLFVMPAVRGVGLRLPHLLFDATLLIAVVLVLALARSRIARAVVLLSVTMTVAGLVWRQERPGLTAETMITAAHVLPQLALLWVISTAVFGRGRVTYHRILGAIVMYLGLGMIFATLDNLLVKFVPDAFTNLPSEHFALRQALTYFSFSTLTTSSFGDIMPMHPIARSLANLEAICGQLFPAILLAQVVGLHSARRRDARHLSRPAMREVRPHEGTKVLPERPEPVAP